MSVTDTTDLGRVGDGETLYRSVPQQPTFLAKDEGGALRLSSAAFDDSGNEISLFRHDLCEAPPFSDPPRRQATAFVLSLVASRIRQEQISFGNTGETLNLDVRPDTTEDQHASHAVVYPDRSVGTKVFRKIKRRMAEIVEEDWPIMPDSDFIASLPIKTAEQA